MDLHELVAMQGLPLEEKIRLTVARIGDWYDAHFGKIYVAYSGGIDSAVLGDITRRLYPDVPFVFANTGMEYSQIVDFVK